MNWNSVMAKRPGGLHKKFFLFLTEKVSPFIRNKNVKVLKMTNNIFTMSLPYKSSFRGLVDETTINAKEFNYHTGVLATLIDHVGGFGAWSFLSNHELRISTANLRIDYLHDPTTTISSSDQLLFDAHIFHIGSKIAKADITCWNSDRSVKIAIGRGSYNIYSIANRPNPLMEYLEYFPTILYPLLPWVTAYLFKQRIQDIQSRNKGSRVNVVLGSTEIISDGDDGNNSELDKDSTANTIENKNIQESNTSASSSSCSSSTVNRYGGKLETDFRKEVTDGSQYVREILQMEVDKINYGKLSIKLPLKYDYVGNPALPALHGGVTAALIEHCSTYCARTTCNDENILTWATDSRIDYLRAAPCYGHMYCDSVVEHISSKIIRVDSICWDESRKHKVALGRVTILLSSLNGITI